MRGAGGSGPRVVVVDAGVGNLGNMERALAHVGAAVEISCAPARVAAARCLVLPGVGAFGPPREALRGPLEAALAAALADGAWLLGICVGFQLLFETSEEFGVTDGLGLLPGRVTRLPAGVPVPHIGWNRLHGLADHPLFAGLGAGEVGGDAEEKVEGARRGETEDAGGGGRGASGGELSTGARGKLSAGAGGELSADASGGGMPAPGWQRSAGDSHGSACMDASEEARGEDAGAEEAGGREAGGKTAGGEAGGKHAAGGEGGGKHAAGGEGGGKDDAGGEGDGKDVGRRGRYFYFVHSYAPKGVPAEVCLARVSHGRDFAAVAARGRVMGTQFHPERSGTAGLRLLANFLEIADGTASGH